MCTPTLALSSWSKTESVVLCGGGSNIGLSGSLGSFFTIPKVMKITNNYNTVFTPLNIVYLIYLV